VKQIIAPKGGPATHVHLTEDGFSHRARGDTEPAQLAFSR
jgi:hypothetical protein